MFAVTLASAFSVKAQLGVGLEVEQAPDQNPVLPPPALSVTWVPTGKPADADCPDVKLKPAGLELTVTPLRPVATTVSCPAGAGGGDGGLAGGRGRGGRGRGGVAADAGSPAAATSLAEVATAVQRAAA